MKIDSPENSYCAHDFDPRRRNGVLPHASPCRVHAVAPMLRHPGTSSPSTSKADEYDATRRISER
jgi:hypothetical protein